MARKVRGSGAPPPPVFKSAGVRTPRFSKVRGSGPPRWRRPCWQSVEDSPMHLRVQIPFFASCTAHWYRFGEAPVIMSFGLGVVQRGHQMSHCAAGSNSPALNAHPACVNFTRGNEMLGEFYSPGWPGRYPRNTNCTRTLTGERIPVDNDEPSYSLATTCSLRPHWP